MLESTRPWHVVLGGNLPLDRVWDKRLRSLGKLPAVSYWKEVERLPRVARAFDGVDTLWLLTSDREFLDQWQPEQWQAVVEWVQSGGRLVLSLGQNAQRWGSGSGPLVPLLPATPRQVIQITEAPGLESFAHADQPLGPFTAVTCDRSDLPALTWFDARHAGRQPAICRYAVGLGVVTWVMFDLDQPAFESWSATPAVLAELARQAGGEPPAGREELTRRVVHIGFDEMVGQLRSALDFFPGSGLTGGVALVSFTAVAALLVLYILWLGPGDYALLWLLKGRREWTWLTWTIGIIAFSVLIHFLHTRWKSPAGPIVNRVELVDIDADTGHVRGTTWASVYSHRLAKYSWHLKPSTPIEGSELQLSENLLTWQGLPGTGLGGLDRTAVETLSGIPYPIRTFDELRRADVIEAPILAAGTRALLGQWRGKLSRPIGSGLWADRNGFLKGSFQNPLSVPLKDVLIAHQRWAYRAEAAIEPGATIRIEQLQRRDLEWLLTERRILGTKVGYASTPWDQQSRNVDRILEVMMFYAAAGGRTYTGLGQQYQSFVDMSDQLSLDRAIVVARVSGPAVELLAEPGTDKTRGQCRTYYRFVMPVRRTEYPVGEAAVQ
ncbi:MAG: hypothetical protein KatS3mg110_2270 [Pirellulaceae bacterium]|nr:MAG: hypothetical protein KatS3mg110_2270 [Pirellulaceae bacterium]